LRLNVRTTSARCAVKNISPLKTNLMIKIRFVNVHIWVNSNLFGVILTPGDHFFKKMESSQFLSVRTIVLV